MCCNFCSSLKVREHVSYQHKTNKLLAFIRMYTPENQSDITLNGPVPGM
jgi:hypothetical protein